MAKRISITLLIAVAISSLGAMACDGHPWFDRPPEALSWAMPTYPGWRVLPEMVAAGVAKLESTPYVEITPMESAHLSGQSNFDDIPGHLLLLRGLNGGGSVRQEGGMTIVLASGRRNATAVAWPVIAKLPNIPSRVYVVCISNPD